MSKISPLFLDFESIRRTYELPTGWQARIAEVVGLAFAHPEFSQIEQWIRYYVDTRHINSYDADKTSVLKRLRLIDSRARALQTNDSVANQNRLERLLTYPTNPVSRVDKARAVAIDYLCTNLLVDPKPGPRWCIKGRTLMPELRVGMFDQDSCQDIFQSVASTKLLLSSTEEENQGRLAPAEGRVIVNDEPYVYRPDPKWKENRKSDADVLHQFAQGLTEVYRYYVAPPYVPADGRNPNQFQRFLRAVTLAIPDRRPAGTALESSARRYLRDCNRVCQGSHVHVGAS